VFPHPISGEHGDDLRNILETAKKFNRFWFQVIVNTKFVTDP
jgi:hypothetical protein